MSQILERKVLVPLLWVSLTLAITSLTAELLPEVEAKKIVVPSLLLVIASTTLSIWKNK